MAQYESGQYINEFLNEMPTLLLTMRKMDVDQMLQTRRLDQQDVSLDLQRKRDVSDRWMRDRQMKVIEAESGVGLEERAEAKRRREAQKAYMKPIHQAMLKEKKYEEAYRKEQKEMSWWDRAKLVEKAGEGWGTFYSLDPEKRMATTEEELAQKRAEEELGFKKEDIPSGADLFEQMLEAGGGELYPGAYDYMLQHGQYGPMMSTKSELLDWMKSGLMSQAGPLALTQGR